MKGLAWLKQSIEKSDKSDGIDIIVIDDGSIDGSTNWIEKKYPDIILLSGDGNQWWSGSMNIGLKYVLDQEKYDYILLWNNDIKPAEDYFINLFQILENSDSGIILCSKIFIMGSSNQIFSMGGYFDAKYGNSGIYNHKLIDKPEYNNIKSVDWCGGMGTTIHKDIFNSIGQFDNINFPQYKGDFDFCIRAKRRGYQIFLYPDLKIWNDISSSGINFPQSIKQFIRSLTDLRSSYNIIIDYSFYKIHIKSRFYFLKILRKYIRYTFLSLLLMIIGENKFKKIQVVHLKNKFSNV